MKHAYTVNAECLSAETGIVIIMAITVNADNISDALKTSKEKFSVMVKLSTVNIFSIEQLEE